MISKECIISKLEDEYLIDFILELLDEKDSIDTNQTLEDTYKLYNNSIIIQEDQLEDEYKLDIYDDEGELLLSIDPPFIDNYSSADYIYNENLLNILFEKIKYIYDSEKIILVK